MGILFLLTPGEATERKATYRRGQVHDRKRQAARLAWPNDAQCLALPLEVRPSERGCVQNMTAIYRAVTPLLDGWILFL